MTIPWARVSRTGDVWLKECRPAQTCEVALAQRPATRWADRHTLPQRYEARCARDPRSRRSRRGFAELCASLTRPPTVQRDDLHASNLYARQGGVVFLDWGESVVGA